MYTSAIQRVSCQRRDEMGTDKGCPELVHSLLLTASRVTDSSRTERMVCAWFLRSYASILLIVRRVRKANVINPGDRYFAINLYRIGGPDHRSRNCILGYLVVNQKLWASLFCSSYRELYLLYFIRSTRLISLVLPSNLLWIHVQSKYLLCRGMFSTWLPWRSVRTR
jgi:hypothetical protein